MRENDNQRLTLFTVSDWHPDVRLTPVNSQTLQVRVSNVAPGLALYARLYDDTGYTSPPLALAYGAGNAYSGTLTLAEPVLDASVHVWASERDPRREVVTAYSLGGNPGNKHSDYGNKHSDYAPVMSSDGQVILYAANLDFAPGDFYALQTATRLPNAPVWATAVGKGYWLSQSPKAPSLIGASIGIGYAQNEVPSGEEAFLRVFWWDGSVWTPLATTLSPDVNLAIAPAQGPGLYVLMSTVEIPLYTGWNLVSYPVQTTRTVTDALVSIQGDFTLVYGYVATDTLSPWRVYAPAAPGYVNDLRVMEFGKAYWIYATRATTLRLTGSPPGGIAAG